MTIGRGSLLARAVTCALYVFVLSCGPEELYRSERDGGGGIAGNAGRSVGLQIAALDGNTTSVSLSPVGETTIKQGTPNQNFGGDTVIRVQQSGRNRGIVLFDTATITQAVGNGTLVSASLTLNIDDTGNNWGSDGGSLGAYRLTKSTGEYSATWNCASDVIYNSSADCSGTTAWTMLSTENPSLQPWVEPATATAVIHSSQAGSISLDVSADVAGYLNGTRTNNGWLLKKVDESTAGQIDFKTHERSAADSPHLVLTIEQPAPIDAGPPDAGFDAGLYSSSLNGAMDSYVREGSPNQNQATEATMQIKASGRNRALVAFDQSQLNALLAGKGMYGATLEVTIAETHPNWGPDRAIGVHVMHQLWNDLGVTWNCAYDHNTSNSNDDCTGIDRWTMWKPQPEVSVVWNDPPTSTTLIASAQTGVVSFDVTRDIACYLAGYRSIGNAWLIKKEVESQAGWIELATRETNTPPRLVLSLGDGVGVHVTSADCTWVAPAGGTCTPIGAVDDDCNGVDDDCDFTKDEDYSVADTSCGYGACASNGVTSCVAGAVVDNCTPKAPSSSTDTTCDGVDDDCSGQIDEDYVPVTSTCGVGACAGMGSTTCVNGAVVISDCQPNMTPECVMGSPCSESSECEALDTPENPAICIPQLPGGYCFRQCDASHPCPTNATCFENNCLLSCNAGHGCDRPGQHCQDISLLGFPEGGEACLPDCGSNACPGDTYCDAKIQLCGSCEGSDESCDGSDNDCDGVVDEGFAPASSECGHGACASSGTVVCNDGVAQDDCVPAPGCEASCFDHVDDDHDGLVDCSDPDCADTLECRVGSACSDDAECAVSGKSAYCNKDLPGGYCTSSCRPSQGDDDCAPGLECLQTGMCAVRCGASDQCADPRLTCADDPELNPSQPYCRPTCTSACATGTYCNPASSFCLQCVAEDAVCDSIDEDCDGHVDEEAGYAISCGAGACANTGEITCTNGVFSGECVPHAPLGPDTTCDNVDDDCDGTKDEDFPSRLTLCGIGACARETLPTCMAGGILVNACIPGTPASSDATCNGVDDNCNGQTDEDYVATPSSCGFGVCARQGMLVCLPGGHVSDTCTPGAGSPDVTCDGVDDNCNGQTDEQYVVTASSCGVGACLRQGQVTCVAGQPSDTCQPGSPLSADATCDGVDDDCDGRTDEDFAPQASTCGAGGCRASGSVGCVAGSVVDSCVVPSNCESSCVNSTDDDGDGLKDCSDPDCAAERECRSGKEFIGDPCCDQDVGSCGRDGFCFSVFPAGYCSTDCAGGCPQGTFCSVFSGFGYCLAACDATEHCADPGLVCSDLGPLGGEGKACMPAPCRAGDGCTDCQPEGYCNDARCYTPPDDTCDGIDQDRDGIVDEAFVPHLVACGTVPAAGQGTESCVDGTLVVTGCPEANCNDGVDDDSDGTIDCNDPDCTPNLACVIGHACTSTSDCTALDVGGAHGLFCSVFVPGGSCTTSCDYSSDPNGTCPQGTTCAAGSCWRSCLAGDSCSDSAKRCSAVPSSGDPDKVCRPTCDSAPCAFNGCDVTRDTCTCEDSDSTCDGHDDDCDGNTDEDAAQFVTTCGLNACAGRGVATCSNGAYHDDCVVGCELSCADAIDEDYDGFTDCDDPDCATANACTGEVAHIGSACCSDSECSSIGSDAYCGTFFPGGYCLKPCGDGCPSGSYCFQGSFCLAECGADDDSCADPRNECGAFSAEPDAERFCKPTCDATDCSVCDPNSGLCDVPLRCGPQADATCNNIDDDQDGSVDEGVPLNTIECGAGACASTGQEGCSFGTMFHYCPTIIPDDGNPCTDDVCSEGIEIHALKNVDDGDACTTDACTSSGSITHTPVPVDDSNPCTADSCDPLTGAIRHIVLSSSSFNDGNQCTVDSCNSVVGVTHVPVEDDHNLCTVDTCTVEANGFSVAITHTPIDVNDNNVCTVDACAPAAGVTHTSVVIDDHDPCTTDSCDPSTGVSHVVLPRGTSCSDGYACNGLETCRGPCLAAPTGLTHWWRGDGDANDSVGTYHGAVEGSLEYSAGLFSEAFDLHNDAGARIRIAHAPELDLTSATRASFTGWFRGTSAGTVVANYDCSTHLGWYFNTSLGCVVNSDQISNGPGFSGVNFNDGNYHQFACVKRDFYVSTYVDGVFRGGIFVDMSATSADVLIGGGAESSCAGNSYAGNIDELQVYDHGLGDAEIAAAYASRNQGGYCKESTSCIYPGGVQVDDGNSCTSDICDPVTGVSHAILPAGSACTDGNACTADFCDGSGHCLSTVIDIDDHDVCTADSCTPESGVVHGPVSIGTSCSDGNACNGLETCQQTCATSPTGLAYWWTADGTAADLFGAADGATVGSVEYASGVSDRAFRFHGSQSERVAVPHAAGLNLADKTTASFAGWYKTTSNSGTVIGKGCSATRWAFGPSIGCQIGLNIGNAVPTADGQYHHFACVKNGNTVFQYIDGQLRATGGVSSAGGGTEDLVIGGADCGSNPTFNGDVDELQIYTTALSGGDIASLYASRNTGWQCKPSSPTPCRPGLAPVVDDGNVCTVDSCDPIAGVAHIRASTGTACNDSNACTAADACNSNGACVGTPFTYDDHDPCTSDACDPTAGVSHIQLPAGTSCSDNNVCTGAESCGAPAETFVHVNPRETFMRLRDDEGYALFGRALPISSFGWTAGQHVLLRRAGSFSTPDNGSQRMAAVFSSSTALLNGNKLNRVPGAIATDLASFITPNIGVVTDIPQDFEIPTAGVTVTIPVGAAYLFVSSIDTFKSDNTDLDGDWGFRWRDAALPMFGCQTGTALPVDDGDACTADTCDPVAGVQHSPYPQGAHSCITENANCGTIDDGCGGSVFCGNCDEFTVCGAQEPHRCGPPGLAFPVVIDVPKATNVAAVELGASVIEPSNDPSAALALSLSQTQWNTPLNNQPKVLTVHLIDGGPHVIDRISFTSGTPQSNPGQFEIWVSDHEPFDTNSFTKAFEGAAFGVSFETRQFVFPSPVRARYLKLVLVNPGVTSNWSRTVERFAVYTRDRDGGVVSLVQGGASVVSATVPSTASTGVYALDANPASAWSTTGPNQSLIFELAAPGHHLSQLDLLAFAIPNAASHQLKDFEIAVSGTGTASADFTTIYARTLPFIRTTYRLGLPPQTPAARYVKVTLLSNYAGPTAGTSLNTFDLYSDELGGATVPFGDRSGLPDSEVASRLWDFGDGTTSTAAHPLHTYAAPGTYTVTLTVHDVNGGIGKGTKQYTALQPPVVDFTYPAYIQEVSSSFQTSRFESVTVFAQGANSVRHYWSGPDTQMSTCVPFQQCNFGPSVAELVEPYQNVRFNQSGPHPLTLRVVDSNFLSGTLTKTIDVVNVPPQVFAGLDAAGLWGTDTYFGTLGLSGIGFGEAFGDSGSAVNETGTVDQGLVHCSWDYGDGSAIVNVGLCHGRGSRAHHNYALPGTYVTTYTAYDDASDTSDTLTVTIDRHNTYVVPFGLTPTAEDGKFDLTAQVFDELYPGVPLVGKPIVFGHGVDSQVALTDATGTAHATITFEQLSYSTLSFEFAGDALYKPSSEYVDYLVREGDTEPHALAPAQQSHEGTRFVLGFPQNSYNVDSAPRSMAAVLLSSRTPTQVTVRWPGGDFEQTVELQASEPKLVKLDQHVRMGPASASNGDFNTGYGGDIEDKGIEVTSPNEIAVYGMSIIGATSDAFEAIPLAHLGTDYLVLGYRDEKWEFYQPHGSQAAVVASEDNTHVTITPSEDISEGPDLPFGAVRGVPFTITLNKLQTFQLIAKTQDDRRYEDISGTAISSDKPIAVYGGHVCTTVYATACDHVVEQIPPLSDWGTRFLTGPVGNQISVVRIVASQDDTEVRIDDHLVETLARGQVYHTTMDQTRFHEFTTTHPALVATFASSLEASNLEAFAIGTDGDPMMVLIPPADRFLADYAFATPPRVYNTDDPARGYFEYHDWINVVARAEDIGGVRVDGQPITQTWQMIGHGEYAGVRVPISSGAHRVRHVNASIKMGVTVYGLQGYDSYGYPAGMDFGTVTCAPTQTLPGDAVDNDCDGLRDEEILDGLDNDGDGTPDEDLQFVADINTPNHAPTLSGGSYLVRANGPFRFPLNGFDSDRDSLTYTVATPPARGTATIQGAVLIYTPDWTAPNATYNVGVRASDGRGGQSTVATIALAVTNVTGGPPYVTKGADSAPGMVEVNFSPYGWGSNLPSVIRVAPGGIAKYGGMAHALDFDTDPVLYLRDPSFTYPSSFTLDQNSGAVQWTVTDADVGVHSFRVLLRDSRSAQTLLNTNDFPINWTVNVQLATDNNPPVITSTAPQQTPADADFTYQVLVSDPDSLSYTYSLVVGPAAASINAAGMLTWHPTTEDVGAQTMLVSVKDEHNNQATQLWTLVVGQPQLLVTSTPALSAIAGQSYAYQPVVSDTTGSGEPLEYSLTQAPGGMGINLVTGAIVWTPGANQLGTYNVILAVRNASGATGSQHFSVQVTDLRLAPHVITSPVTSAVVQGAYVYDVNAEDFGEREQLFYSLDIFPPGMDIDPVTGLIQWIPSAASSEPVTVRVTDATGLFDTQTFQIAVHPDTAAPTLTFTGLPTRVALNASTTLGLAATDDVLVESYALTIAGIPFTLDVNHQTTFSSAVPGLYPVVGTVTDSSGNTTTKTSYVAVSEAVDNTPPTVTLTSPSEDALLTYIHDVIGSVSDDHAVYRVELAERSRGVVGWNTFATSYGAVTSSLLGKLDTTLLVNGYHELRVRAEDLNGNLTELVRPFMVDGQAKVGPVQLSFVDAAVPVAGIPVTVVRSYDSRTKNERGDFGYGWKLDVKRGSAQHNRSIGDGFAIYTSREDFSLPCGETYQQKSHYTEIRLSDREHYIFAPYLTNTTPNGNTCRGEVSFSFVDGTSEGATLDIVGGSEQFTVISTPQVPVFNPEVLAYSTLSYALHPELEFDPQLLRLTLPDGRVYDIDVTTGIKRIQDRNGNQVFFNANGVQNAAGRGISFQRDLQGRIDTLIEPSGKTVSYNYDLNGDLVRVDNQLGESTRFVYRKDAPFQHHIDKVTGPDGTRLAKMSYDEAGRLNSVCDAENGCSQSAYDLAARSVVQTDATARATQYTYDLRGNVTSQTDGLNHAVSFQYDGDDNLIRAEGPDGSVATYAYDGSKNLLTRVLPHEANEPAADFTYTYTYTSKNDRETVTLPSGGVIRYVYDTAGNQISVKDGAGNVIQSMTYDAQGRVKTSTDRFGTKSYDYAATSDASPFQMTDPFGAVIVFNYDDNGRLLARSERGLTTTMAYDDLGRKKFVDYGNGSKVTFGYTTGKPDWTSIAGTNPSSAAPVCAGDADCDGVLDAVDNCPLVQNTTQTNTDSPQGTYNAAGPVSVWRFEEASGNTAVDETGAHPGTFAGSSQLPVRNADGRFGKSLQFNGASNVNFGTWFNYQSYSISMWVKAYTPQAQTQTQLADIIDNNHATGRSWVVQGDTANNYTYSAGDGAVAGAAFTMVPNQWYHLAVTRDAATHTNRAYLNGTLIAENRGTQDINYDGSQTLRIGTGILGRFWRGELDELAIYDRPLTPTEVKAHATVGLYGDGMGDACDPCANSMDASCAPAGCTDEDGDGYGVAGASACGHGADKLDCDDHDAARHYGQLEQCDSVDNNCDGQIDEGCGAVTTLPRVERSFSAKGLLSGWKGANGDTFTRLYDAGGRVKEEIDALGNRTVYGYDAAGRLAAITDVTLGATTLFERDAAGRVTKTTDALGHETTTAYKAGGRLESTTNARGKTTSFDRNPLSASITDALNRTTVTSLSTYGLPLGTQYPGGSDTGSSYLGTTRLDGSQQFPTSFEDEMNRARNYGYDAKSGLTSATDLAGQQWQYQYTPAAGSGVSYDVMSGNVSTANQDGGASAYQSSGGGTEYRDVATTGGSDGGNFSHMLSQVTSPMGEVTKFERGTNGRINKVQYPDGGTRTIAYDAANRPQTITLPQGTVVTLGHDGLGRETSRTTSTGEFRYLTYGVGDRIETMTDNTGTTDYEYDSAGRFSGIVYPSGASVTYGRDKLNRTTDVTVTPKIGATPINTHYTYDEDGNLAEILDPTNHTTAFSYDDVDRLATRLLPNGVTTTYSYDGRDRVLSVVHRNASNVVLASVSYVRAPTGEPTKITREDGTYVALEYDAALRVKKESYFDASDNLVQSMEYGYDNDGNRTSKTVTANASVNTDTYNNVAGFKLDSVMHSAGGADDGFQYDGGGRLIGMDRGGVHRTMEYDSNDHVTRVVDGGIERARYTFDGMGQRVSADDGTGVKRFLTAPNLGDGYESPQAVTDVSGAVLATFVYANGQAIAKITPTGVEYFLGDAMGSVVGKTDEAGASRATIKYDGFGNVISAVGPASSIDSAIGTEQRFQGMQLDAATGIYFVRARSYDATTGRFVSRDPFAGIQAQPETMNPYVFVGSNPFVYCDPNGKFFTLMEVTVAAVIVGILAGGASAAISNLHYLRDGKISTGQYAGSIFVGATVGGVAGFLGAELGVMEGIIIGNAVIGGAGSEFLNSIVTGQMSSASDYAFAVVGGIVGGVAGAAVTRQLKIVGALDLAEMGGVVTRGLATPSLQVTGTRMVAAGGQTISPWVQATSILKFGVDSPEVIKAAHNATVDIVVGVSNGVLSTTVTAARSPNSPNN